MMANAHVIKETEENKQEESDSSRTETGNDKSQLNRGSSLELTTVATTMLLGNGECQSYGSDNPTISQEAAVGGFETDERRKTTPERETDILPLNFNEDIGQEDSGSNGGMRHGHDVGTEHMVSPVEDDWARTIAGVAGNVLEWYDFAVFGYFSDILGDVFFPPDQNGHAAIMESFAVFGGAFFMRPIGGVLMGYIGDAYGSRKALTISVFLMAFPTFAMGCLPGYSSMGALSIIFLTLVRLLQGLSAGGQLMSSLVFTLEHHPKSKWGLYGSYVMATANFGTLLGGLAATIIRRSLSDEDLHSWGWRIPFLCGILVSLSGYYLRSHGGDDDPSHIHGDDAPIDRPPPNPLLLALSPSNRRSLLASSMIPLLWSTGFYLIFVWMAVYMTDLIEPSVPNSFAVNSASLCMSVCLFFPVGGWLSDRFGRKKIMGLGGFLLGVFSPVMIVLIASGNPFLAFLAQSFMGISLSLWGAPMMAWLVESFEPSARLTSVSIGYNIAQALGGGICPVIATRLVDTVGPKSPGFYLTVVSSIALVGLFFVSPSVPAHFADVGNQSRGSANYNNGSPKPGNLSSVVENEFV